MTETISKINIKRTIEAVACFSRITSKPVISKITPLEVSNCLCDRDIAATELQIIVRQLREKEKINDTGNKSDWQIKQNVYTLNDHNLNSSHITNQTINEKYISEDESTQKKRWIYTKNGVLYLKFGKVYYNLATAVKDETVKGGVKNFTVRESQFDVLGYDLFISSRSEKIKSSEVNNYTLFAKYLNEAFNKYDINTCIRKIHFLAQCYHESQRFVNTYEGLAVAPANYKGGVDFQGRGIKQITHDFNYLACYDEQEKIIYESTCNGEESDWDESPALYDIYIKNRDKQAQSVTAYLKKYGTKHGFPKNFIETLNDFKHKISTNLKDACVSAGFFWEHQKVHSFADDDDVKGLTKKINGLDNGLSQREKYTKDLKEIFDYDNCTSK